MLFHLLYTLTKQVVVDAHMQRSTLQCANICLFTVVDCRLRCGWNYTLHSHERGTRFSNERYYMLSTCVCTYVLGFIYTIRERVLQ